MNFPPEFEDEFKELQFALENTERGGWFFAVYKQWKVAEELIQRLRNSTELPVFQWQYSQDKPSYPVDYLQSLTPEQKAQRAIVMLFHVASGGEKVIKSLDFNRERFADFPHCLLFWVTESELREIANGAGHFWAQRGGRFDFSQFFVPDDDRTESYQYSDWASSLLHVENYREAEQQLDFYVQELEQHKHEIESIELAELYDKIAYLLSFLGKYKEASPLAEISLEIKRKQLGENHPNVAVTLNNLALLYKNQERYEESLLLFQQALAIWEKHFGENSLDVAISLTNLASLYRNQQHYEEALLFCRRALAIRENQLSKNDLRIASSLHLLATLYDIQGRYAEALPLYQRALAISEQQLGENHPYVSNSLNNLAGIYYKQGNYAEALPLYRKALAILEKSLGSEHPDTKLVKKNYEQLQKKQKNWWRRLLGKMSES